MCRNEGNRAGYADGHVGGDEQIMLETSWETKDRVVRRHREDLRRTNKATLPRIPKETDRASARKELEMRLMETKGAPMRLDTNGIPVCHGCGYGKRSWKRYATKVNESRKRFRNKAK